MELWELIRYLHVLGLALFIGGQIMLVSLVASSLLVAWLGVALTH